MAEVFIAERGQLDDRSKRELRKVGVVVVELDDLTRGHFIRAESVVSGDAMLWAAIDALATRAKFKSDDHEAKLNRLAANLLRLTSHLSPDAG